MSDNEGKKKILEQKIEELEGKVKEMEEREEEIQKEREEEEIERHEKITKTLESLNQEKIKHISSLRKKMAEAIDHGPLESDNLFYHTYSKSLNKILRLVTISITTTVTITILKGLGVLTLNEIEYGTFVAGVNALPAFRIFLQNKLQNKNF